jgi:hypothetical protein
VGVNSDDDKALHDSSQSVSFTHIIIFFLHYLHFSYKIILWRRYS